ncbi:MAG: HAMP domain-containing protein [Gammaproteobacteria bacterium]|nr:HAMP domain-containing protein [Gammaproteobacteria bacterium]
MTEFLRVHEGQLLPFIEWGSRVMMSSSLLWKLLGIIVLVIGAAMLVVWITIDVFAADYFSFLMEKYKVPKNEVQQIFLNAAHRYLAWAAVVAISLALILGFLLIKMIFAPLYQMIAITKTIARGDYTGRVQIPSRDEVGQLALAFNRMTDSLQRIEQLRKSMVLDLAHELRVPLTNMRGYLEALRDGVVPPSKQTFLSLHEETLRLTAFAEDLLQLSQADAAQLTLHPQKMDLQGLIIQTLDLFHNRFATKAISVETQFPGETEQVVADPDKLAQVLRNLLQNAWQYTPQGGSVHVSVERTPAWVKVIFGNTGNAIAKEELPFIFERFYRGEKSRSREYGGVGIGLAIVKELIKGHGGQVGAESSVAENCVWFSLPV